MAQREELSDEQVFSIEPFFDKTETVQARGTPHHEDREVMKDVL